MKKKIYIHVGTPKTGTTTIQEFLEENRAVLEQKSYGVYSTYLRETPAERLREFCNKSNPLTPVRDSGASSQWIVEFSEILQQRPEETIVLSEEIFWHMIHSEKRQPFFLELIEKMQAIAEVTLIVYLRRQDSFFMSTYQQRVKSGRQKGQTCVEKLTQMNLGYFNYRDRLKWLLPLVDPDHLMVRTFEPARFFKGSLEADFLRCIGLELTEEFNVLDRKKNPGMTPFLTEISRCLGFFCYTRKDLEALREPSLKEDDRCFNRTRQHQYLSPRDRHQFMEQFEAGNRWVATEILGRKDGVLFYEELPSKEDPWVEYTLDPEEVQAFFKKASFYTASRRKKMCRQVLSVYKTGAPLRFRIRDGGKGWVRRGLRAVGLQPWARRIR